MANMQARAEELEEVSQAWGCAGRAGTSRGFVFPSARAPWMSSTTGRWASSPAWEPLEPAQLPAAMNCKTTSLRLTGFSCRGYNTKLDWCYPASQITYASQLLKVVADISRQVSNTLVLIQKYSSSSLQQSLADHLQFGCKASAVNSHYPTHSYN